MKEILKTKHTLAVIALVCMLTALFPSTPKPAKAASIFVAVDGVKVTEVNIPKGSDANMYLANVDGFEPTVKDTKIADFDELGRIVGKKIGSTKVTFAYKNKKYTCKVNVVPAYDIQVISVKKTDNSVTFKVKNNMKKAVTFYSEGAAGLWYGDTGDFEPATMKKKSVTIQAKKTASIVLASDYDAIVLRAKYDGSKFTYILSSKEGFTHWFSPVWLSYSALSNYFAQD